ncbi:hypothetical protein [Embleya sp. NPDC059237]|uniref:hypothetical protein n=1 Tax=Embleya sp. NPDC059237 TaxID=3346784 RepID=UPI00367B5BD7
MQLDMRQIARECRANHGLTKVSLGELRAEIGYAKLGNWVLKYIAEGLQEQELGFFPVGLLDPRVNEKPRQSQSLWIYDAAAEDSLLAQVAEIISGSSNYRDEDVFSIMTGLGSSDSHTLRLIRELVLPKP